MNDKLDSSKIATRLTKALSKTQADVECYFDKVKKSALDIIRENVAEEVSNKKLKEKIKDYVEDHLEVSVCKYFKQKDIKADISDQVESILADQVTALVNKTVMDVFRERMQKDIGVMIHAAVDKQTKHVVATSLKIANTTFSEAVQKSIKNHFNDEAFRHIITKKIDDLMAAMGKPEVKRLVGTEIQRRRIEGDPNFDKVPKE